MKLSNSRQKNTMLMICMPIVYIVIGVLLLLPEDVITPKVFSYLFAAILMIGGAVLVIKYFFSHGYSDYYSYDFSFGLIALILGIVALVKADDIANSIVVCIGIVILLSSVFKIQYAIQLFITKNVMWIPVISVAVVFVISSILILININKSNGWNIFTYIMLIIDGVVSLAVNIYLYFKIGKHQKEQDDKTQDITEHT